jgi:hypothetical protein
MRSQYCIAASCCALVLLYSFSFSDCSVFRATFTTVKVYNLKSHKTFVLKTIHFTTCFGCTEPSSGELNLLMETAVICSWYGPCVIYFLCNIRRKIFVSVVCMFLLFTV